MRREVQPAAAMRPIAMVRQPRMKERIVDELRRLIIAGTLEPGTVLRQEHLAQQLQVSRTPLREALIALEKEGLIVIAPSGAASVPALDTRDAREIMDVRELVDGLAARLLAERGLSEELDLELSAMAKEMRTTRSDKQRYLVLNAEFHTKLIEATGHARLQQFVPLVRMASEVVYTRAQKEGRRLASSATEHTRILAAIRSGDGEEAERIARAHVRNAARHWLK
ncbi:MAG: GntR family transcriptional regulator [Candidatus Eremiobacteraeota bacterium]|nr:GntR family transcriptional regulator [Candidatus Eremiobacteraeota bacterium]